MTQDVENGVITASDEPLYPSKSQQRLFVSISFKVNEFA